MLDVLHGHTCVHHVYTSEQYVEVKDEVEAKVWDINTFPTCWPPCESPTSSFSRVSFLQVLQVRWVILDWKEHEGQREVQVTSSFLFFFFGCWIPQSLRPGFFCLQETTVLRGPQDRGAVMGRLALVEKLDSLGLERKEKKVEDFFKTTLLYLLFQTVFLQQTLISTGSPGEPGRSGSPGLAGPIGPKGNVPNTQI